MPQYIDPAYVRGLSEATERAGGDALLTDTIKAATRRTDRRLGQYLASGYEGYYRLANFELKEGGFVLATPRLFSLEAVEYRTRYGGEWIVLDSSEYEGYSCHPLSWSGVDTVELSRRVSGQVRVKGKVGWGHNENKQTPFVDDEVPEELRIEMAKQTRLDYSRLPIGGAGGSSVYSADLTVEVDGWLWLMSANIVVKGLIDNRRLIPGTK